MFAVRFMNFGYFSTFQTLDKGLIEKIGPTGFTFSLFNLSSSFTSANSGLISHVVLYITGFLILFFSFFFIFSFGYALADCFQLIFLFFSILLTI
jgi:hypothetical protein